MTIDDKRLSPGRRSGQDRRSGTEARSIEERRLLGERRSTKDRRSGLDRWPAAGSADTELGVMMEPEVCHGEAEVYTRVQA
jgi:hypothetical protein